MPKVRLDIPDETFAALARLAVQERRSIDWQAEVTDPLAYGLLAARILQSIIHLASLSAAAVTARFAAFGVQLGIALYWAVALLLD